ncbi:MAG: FGGY-family carbohydrate kinase [Adhaeribacter sp.]
MNVETKQEAYLVIDIGTGNVRVALARPDGQILAVERDNMPYHKDSAYPESIYFEPNTLWELITGLARKALAQVPGVQVKALTATSQREGIVLIGHQGQSLLGLPNIDHRGREWEGILADKSQVYALTGRFPTSLFSALKLVGVREGRPELWEQVATFLSISDWAQYMLSGVARYEHSQASETLLYDVAQKRWSPELCFQFELRETLLPELAAAGTLLGPVSAGAAAAFGIAADALVVVGGADTQLAVGGTQPELDDVVIVSGTTTPLIKLTAGYLIDQQERSWTNRHTDENSFVLETNAGVTGLNYQRLKEIFYPNEDYEVIEQELAALPPLDCVASLGSLVADEKAPVTRGGFIFPAPVSHLLSRGHFVQATLWDIACSIRENYATLCEIHAHGPAYVWACGGGFQSPLLRQLVANLLGKEVRIRDNYRQASVVGGVLLCNQALGLEALPAGPFTAVAPQNSGQGQQHYQEWKKARSTFKQHCLEKVL